MTFADQKSSYTNNSFGSILDDRSICYISASQPSHKLMLPFCWLLYPPRKCTYLWPSHSPHQGTPFLLPLYYILFLLLELSTPHTALYWFLVFLPSFSIGSTQKAHVHLRVPSNALTLSNNHGGALAPVQGQKSMLEPPENACRCVFKRSSFQTMKLQKSLGWILCVSSKSERQRGWENFSQWNLRTAPWPFVLTFMSVQLICELCGSTGTLTF